jgi:hypothetical protein
LQPILIPGRIVIAFIFFGSFFELLAQKKNEGYVIEIKKASAPITIDGVLSPAEWGSASVAKDFFSVLPMDTSFAKVKTEVRLTYDDDNLYLIAVCFHLLPGPYMVESLRRDFAFGKNDNFLLFMDPFEDQTNGFSFGANAAGAQWDGIMFQGGSVDLSWDNKWTSEVKNDDEKWVFEAAIPFKSIRYKKGIDKWGINFSRLDLKTTEKSAWAPVPRQFPTASLAYTGTLAWDKAPPVPGINISLIPYGLVGTSKDYQKNLPSSSQHEIGADAKISLTSSLNLDLTINPNFSQVEVDRQVTNLDRFELFFPERRQFFLENGDLFGNFGYATVRPFFSRRIGLNAPIQFGGRVSGKLDKNWRIGAMNMQTAKVDDDQLPAQNFSVLSLQRKVFARSNIGLLVINKETIDNKPNSDPKKPSYTDYNRNIGVEYNLASSNNQWLGKAFVLKSFSPNKNGREYTHGANLTYASRELVASWQHEYVGKDFVAEVGYVPRTGYVKINPQVNYLFFPKGKTILSHGVLASSTYFLDESFNRLDDENYVGYRVVSRKQSSAGIYLSHNYVKLLKGFDPTNSGLDTIPRGTEHQWDAVNIEFASKPQSRFTYAASLRYGGYYLNGKRFSFTTDWGYRFQPYVSLALSTTYNVIQLPLPWGHQTFWLISPRIDLTFTNKLFFTAFTQYNQQQNNINLNARFQWRYKPASDLFVVYTDNYLPESFSVKNRALVVKLTYWWGLNIRR